MKCSIHAAERAIERVPLYADKSIGWLLNRLPELAKTGIPIGASTHQSRNLQVTDDGHTFVLGIRTSKDGGPVIITVLNVLQATSNHSYIAHSRARFRGKGTRHRK